MAWLGIALHGISVRVYPYFGGGPAAFCVYEEYLHAGFFPWRLLTVLAVSSSFAYYVCAFACPRGFAWLSIRFVETRVRSSISPPFSPNSGEPGPLLMSFSIELTVWCDGCLLWGLVWRVGLVAGLRVGQGYDVFHRPAFGSFIPVPRYLSTQPPFAMQALTCIYPLNH